MQDSARGSAAARERASVEGSNVSAKRQSRRRWSTEEKARVVRESLRPGERVGEVARRYGISRWQLSTWRSLARRGKLAAASSAEPVGVEPRPQPAFAPLEVDSATGPGPMGSVVIEARVSGGAKVDHGSGGTVPLRRSKTLPVCEPFPVTGRVGRFIPWSCIARSVWRAGTG